MKRKEAVAVETRTYTVVFERNRDGRYTVTCPALPGLVSEGRDLEHARAMAKEAIAGHVRTLRELGWPVPSGEPDGKKAIREPVSVSIPRA
jgi:antitoxin HicB